LIAPNYVGAHAVRPIISGQTGASSPLHFLCRSQAEQLHILLPQPQFLSQQLHNLALLRRELARRSLGR